MTGETCSTRWFMRLARLAAWLVVCAAGIVIAAWLVGRIASDRSLWSQWLLWIPTPTVLFVSVIGLIALLFASIGRARRDRRVLIGGWALAILAIAVFLGVVEHRLYRATPIDGEGVRLVHWSMSHEKEPFTPQAEAILRQQPDVAILNDAWRASDPIFRLWAEQVGGASIRADRFTILSRFPIIERRVVVKNGDLIAAILRVDASERIGRELSMLLVDMPSSPRAPRWELARELRSMLDEIELPPYDIVIGDFNMTRGSAAMRSIFPSLRHAYDDAGGGYAASYHREWPMYHIDHVLLTDRMRATSYRLVDPGVGRHYMQVATVTTR